MLEIGAAPMEALRERQKALRAALAENRRSTRTLEQAEERRQARAWRLTPWLRNVVLILYFLTNHAKEPIVVYLKTVARRRKWPPLSDEEVVRRIDDLYLAVDMGELTALADTENPTDASAMKEASRVCEEWRLAKWVERLNLERGLAPPIGMVLERYEEIRGHLPEAARPPYRGVPAEAAARMWGRRWRLRWGGCHGNVPAREDTPLEEKRNKATMLFQTVRPEVSHFRNRCLRILNKKRRGRSPVSGSGFRSQNWDRILLHNTKQYKQDTCRPNSGVGIRA